MASIKNRAFLITVLIISLLFIAVLAIYGLTIYDRKTLPRRLTASIKEIVVHKELFTESKLISYNEDDPINLNGDGIMTGTYKLSPAEMKLLLSGSLAICPPNAKCSETKTSYTVSQNTQDETYSLDIDPDKNTVTLEVTWY
ncbi:MAG TPA: hypothetical protein VMR45_05670 [Patescibacteria group bacterium]|nr:hypothetical protein [Patescibacteria group bacterium]